MVNTQRRTKPSEQLTTACPYLTDDEAQMIWNKAKMMAWKKGTNRQSYWPTVNRIAVNMARKINDNRMNADETQWREEFTTRQNDWE